MKRFVSIAAVTFLMTAGALATGTAAARSARASAALPTLNVALNGTRGISISGSMSSGAVQIVSTFKGTVPKGPNSSPEFGLIRLNPGVTIQQAAGAVQSHHGDLNALDPFGGLLVDAGAPGVVQTVLTPGNWVALNLTGRGTPGFAPFTVSRSSSPAALPVPRTTQTAIDFSFRGPTVLHDHTIVRSMNQGYLVHMITLAGVKSRAAGINLMSALRFKSSMKAARPFLNGKFVNLLGPASQGAMQQATLNTNPGWYVEACFMDTQDGREHVKLGMERLVKVIK